MTSIRRTLSPYHDRSQPNGSNNPFAATPQSPSSRKLFSNGRVNLSPLRRALAELLVQKQQHPRRSNISWRKPFLLCLLFFILGLLFGMSPFNSDFVNEFKNQDLRNSEVLVKATQPPVANVVESSVSDGVTGRGKETEVVPGAVEVGVVNISSLNEVKNVLDLVPEKQIIVVTPTYNRAMQAYYLNRLGQVLRLVRPPLLWIVVEFNAASMETAETLRNMGVIYRHLVCAKNVTDVKDRGVHQRNTALEHIERHRLHGIVYFADEDNIYSLELFESIRGISHFGTWPVGVLGQSQSKAIMQGPVCNGSQVIGWHTNEKGRTLGRFHANSSGFAFNSTILWDPERWHRLTSDPIRQIENVKDGFQETSFIEQIMEDESRMECLPSRNCRIMNWNLHIEAQQLVYPKGWKLQKNLDVLSSYS